MKGDIPRDRDGRSKGTKAKKSIFGEQVRHPLAGPRGLEAEGEGGFCREEIRLLGRGLLPPWPPSPVSCPHVSSSQDPVQQLWIIPGSEVTLNSSSGSRALASGRRPPRGPLHTRRLPACVRLEVGEGPAEAQRPG